jgi:hypothetical protein
MRGKGRTAARLFLYGAVALVSVSASAAPPDGADPNSPLGAWYRSLQAPDDPDGRSCDYVPITVEGRVVESKEFNLERLD